jgi:hypothetical protein|nr:MAG TPA: hypothetical protein [Caudoviricetes sp.]
MAEYIEREAALTDFEQCNRENPSWTPQRVKQLLVRQPAADVVEVVRCGNCEYKRDTLYCRLRETPAIVSNADFCSFGKRRDE